MRGTTILPICSSIPEISPTSPAPTVFLPSKTSERFCRQRRSWSTPLDGFPDDRRDAARQWFGRESSNVENASEIRSRFRHFENKNCLHPLSGEHDRKKLICPLPARARSYTASDDRGSTSSWHPEDIDLGGVSPPGNPTKHYGEVGWGLTVGSK